VTALLQHGYGGKLSPALAAPLVAADAIDIARLPTSWRGSNFGRGALAREVHPRR
jgi:hypothetical protein